MGYEGGDLLLTGAA